MPLYVVKTHDQYLVVNLVTGRATPTPSQRTATRFTLERAKDLIKRQQGRFGPCRPIQLMPKKAVHDTAGTGEPKEASHTPGDRPQNLAPG